MYKWHGVLTKAALARSFRRPPHFSPDVGIIRKVLSSPVDFTLSQWFTRALCVPDVSASWAKWSDPTSPPHRDAPDALAAFAEAASMDVPHNLLSPDPDVAADACVWE